MSPWLLHLYDASGFQPATTTPKLLFLRLLIWYDMILAGQFIVDTKGAVSTIVNMWACKSVFLLFPLWFHTFRKPQGVKHVPEKVPSRLWCEKGSHLDSHGNTNRWDPHLPDIKPFHCHTVLRSVLDLCEWFKLPLRPARIQTKSC
jgi:hypothetical protein